MTRDLTTLQLARAIGSAVRRAGGRRHRNSTKDPATQAVLRTLHRTDSWFIRKSKDDFGATVTKRYEPADGQTQPELFT